MNKLVKSMVEPVAEENGWNYTISGVTTQFDKDGYEIWFGNDGFELTILDPDTSDRKVIFEQREHEGSPFYYATLLHVLDNAEIMVARCE